MDGIKRLAEVYQSQETNALENKKHTENQLASIQMQETIVKSFESLVRYLDNRVSKTTVVNQLKEIGTPDALKVAQSVESLHETIKTHKNTDLTEITSIMSELLSEAKKLPKENPEIPEQKFVDYTKQLTGLEKAVKAVERVVKEQKLIAEAPIINVPETNVNVEAPDLQPLQESIKDVVGAVESIVIPEYKTDNKSVEELLKKSNKLLKNLLEKPVASGGGGSTWVSVNTSGTPVPIELESDGSVPVTVVAGGSGGGLTDAELRATPVPVSGTVAATQSGTWTEANSAAIKTAVETIDNAISGSEMQVDVVGALPAGTNAIGKLAANSGVDIGDVDVTSAVSSTLDHGSNLDIDTSAEQITSTSFACKFGVTLKAAATNTGTLYIGDSSSVTAGTTGSTDGFPLEPGESVTLPVNNPNLLYAIASVANQKIFWVAT